MLVETPGQYAQRPRDDEGADIDYVLIGPYDPPRAVGAATMEEPAVEELVQKVVTASRAPGTAAGYVTSGPPRQSSVWLRTSEWSVPGMT